MEPGQTVLEYDCDTGPPDNSVDVPLLCDVYHVFADPELPMSMSGRRHVFGPVPSRRLGRSLGLDLVPFKTCTYDCVYCQLGRTTHHTVTREAFVPVAAVLSEVAEVLASGPPPDYVTLSGSGEPTLYAPLAELIGGLKALSPVPVAVLTNGSLLWQPAVRADLAQADLVVPSLDAGDEARFRQVNRPCAAISFDRMVAGLIAFGREFGGRLWLEVFLLDGITTDRESLQAMAGIVGQLRPERVQLNTVARPPAEAWARAATTEQLAAARAVLGEYCEVISDYAPSTRDTATVADEAAVLGLLQRRPCRLQDLANGLGLHRNALVKHLEHLQRAGAIGTERVGEDLFYRAARPTDETEP